MKTRKWEDVRREHLTAKEIAKNDAWARREVLEMNLRQLRDLAGKTQKELSARLKVEQPQVSRIEKGADHLVSTLREYVEALGGELEVIARFGDKTMRLRGV